MTVTIGEAGVFMPDSPYELNLSPETRRQLEITLCSRVSQAISDAADRDSQLRIWRDQLENLGVTANNPEWVGACDLPDPISFEAFLTILSQLQGAMHRDPKVAVESFDKEDEENAKTLEAWLSVAGAQSDIDARLTDFAYNACVDPAVVGYCGWSQVTRQKRETAYRAKGSSALVQSDDEDENLEPVPILEEVTEERYDIRAVDLSDFYLYPADAVSVDRATAVAERMFMTEEELWDGIKDFGYERDAVEELTRFGPAGDTGENKQRDADIDGVQPGGYYEIYTCYTRMPRKLPGEVDSLPEHLLQDDFLVVLCPVRNLVLKIAYSPFTERPYWTGGILPKPGKVQGHGLMGILEPLQCEANANLQLGIDASNQNVAPEVIAPTAMKQSLAKQKRGVGQVIFVDGDVKDIVNWPMNNAPLRDTLAIQQDIRSRARAVISAEGQGQLQNKVRKNEEVRAVESASSAKFGMYLSNFQRTVVAEVFRRMIALKNQFGDVDEDGEDFIDSEGRSRKLTARALKGKYSIVATGTSLTHSPEARVEIGKQKQAVQAGYLQAKVGLPPDMHPLLWHGARELLFDLGERNPEAWIGEEPKAQEAQQAPQQIQPGQAQPGMNGTGHPPPGMMLGGMMGANN